MASIPKTIKQVIVTSDKNVGRARSALSNRRSRGGSTKCSVLGNSDSRGDDDDHRRAVVFNVVDFSNSDQRGKIATLPNAEVTDLPSASGSSPLTIKSREVGVSSASSISEILLTVSDVAAILRVSPTTVYRMVEDRKMPFVRVGSLIRFTRDNLKVFLQNGHTNPII